LLLVPLVPVILLCYINIRIIHLV